MKNLSIIVGQVVYGSRVIIILVLWLIFPRIFLNDLKIVKAHEKYFMTDKSLTESSKIWKVRKFKVRKFLFCLSTNVK